MKLLYRWTSNKKHPKYFVMKKYLLFNRKALRVCCYNNIRQARIMLDFLSTHLGIGRKDFRSEREMQDSAVDRQIHDNIFLKMYKTCSRYLYFTLNAEYILFWIFQRYLFKFLILNWFFLENCRPGGGGWLWIKDLLKAATVIGVLYVKYRSYRKYLGI